MNLTFFLFFVAARRKKKKKIRSFKKLLSLLTWHRHEARRARLGQPVALHHGRAHTHRQEVLDVSRQGSSAADDQPDPPPQSLLELGEDKLVEERGGAGHLDPAAQRPQLAPEPPVEQQGLDASGLCDLGGCTGVNAVEDPRDAEEERGPEGADVVDEVLDVALVVLRWNERGRRCVCV